MLQSPLATNTPSDPELPRLKTGDVKNVYGWEQYRRKLEVCQAEGRPQK
jgi:hypothetical protein